MAQTITRSISIDVAQENRLQPIVAKQYDRASRFLNVQFLDMGTEMTIEQGATIVINAKRSDGQGLSFSGSVNSDGTVRVPITYWMLELDGPVVCDISIITGSSADTMLTSTSFTLEVQAAAVTNADVEENEDYPVLLELIHEVSEFEPELLDIRNGVHGQTFNSAGDAVRASAEQLYNMKTGFDGVTYSSPAAAVRGSDEEIDQKLQFFKSSFFNGYDNNVLFGANFKKGGYYNGAGSFVSDNNYWFSDPIEIKPSTSYKSIDTGAAFCALFNTSNEFIIGWNTSNNETWTSASTAKYLIICPYYTRVKNAIVIETLQGLYNQYGLSAYNGKCNIGANMRINKYGLFNTFAQSILSDLNDAEENSIYTVQRLSGTTTTHFPDDFPDDGSISILKTYKTIYDAQGNYQKFQILTTVKSLETWRRSYNSSQGSWGTWTKSVIGGSNGAIIHIGSGQAYTTLRAGIAAAMLSDNSTVYVHPGTYDLKTEFSDVISSSMLSTGIAIGNGIHIIFYDGAKVTALFDQNDYDSTTWRKIYDNFQPFYASGGDYVLENLNIETKDTRYCVHDENNGIGTYSRKYVNCNMKYTNTHSDINYVQCIGGGLGEHGSIVIDGGYYESVTDYGIPSTGGGAASDAQQPISYHNGNNSNCDGSIIIKNVYLKNRGYFRFGWYGPSSIKTQIQINGCSTGLPTLVKSEVANNSNPVNFELTEFNEDVRTTGVHWELSESGYKADLVSNS